MPRPRDAAASPPPPGSCRHSNNSSSRSSRENLVLVTIALVFLSFPPARAMAPRISFNSEGRKLFGGYRIVPQPCKSTSESRHGVCMFNYECVQRAGEVIGACMDGFLFGACCHLPPGSLLPTETASQPVKNAVPAPSTVGVSSEVLSIVSPSSTTSTSKPSQSNVVYVSTKLPMQTPPTFKPKTTQRPPVTLLAEEHIDNTASISHILNLLNDSASIAETIPVSSQRPEPSLSTWVSINGHYPSTQKYPSVLGPQYTVDHNEIQPVTPRPTPSAPAPTVIVLGPFTNEHVAPPVSEYISRPGSSRPVEAAVVQEDEQIPVVTTTTEFVLPTFEDADLGNKIHVFADKIVNSLAGDFQNLEDVVLSKKNLTIAASTTSTSSTTTTTTTTTTTPKPTPKPTRRPTTARPITTTVAAAPPVVEAVEADLGDDYKSKCGVRPLMKKNGRIVGGKGAAFGEWPWQVLVRESTWLGLFTKNKCGGVLITNKYVITAAHCQPGFLASLVAVFGEFDLSGELESRRAVVKNVRRVIIHRSYEPATFENDIALLELESPVTYDKHIVPICLPDDSADFTGRVATVSGWGRLKYGGGVPNVLQVVQVPVIENNVCQEMFHTAGHPKVIIPSFLCAGYANGQKDSCEGDSGGPLMVERDGRWILVGTVSHGIKCAAPYLPGVYMRTTYYKTWLKTITGIS